MLIWAGLPKPITKFYLLGVIQSIINIVNLRFKHYKRVNFAILWALTINH